MTDFEMQITDFETAYDGSGKFEFSVNPTVLNFPIAFDKKTDEIAYGRYHVYHSAKGIKPVQYILNGNFFGDNRNTEFNSFSKKLDSNDIKQFWLNSDTFFYMLGGQVRRTLNSDRTRFVDYVASLVAVSPYVYKTARNSTKNVTNASETTTNALTNNGSADSVAKITITNNSSSNITKIEIGDGNTLSSSVHKFVWANSTGLASGETLIIYPFKMFNLTGVGQLKSLRKSHPEKSGGLFGYTKNFGYDVPHVTAGTSSQVFSIKLTGCDASTDVRLDWNDAYYG